MYWKSNSSFLNDNCFVEEIEQLSKTFDLRTLYIDILENWELLKEEIQKISKKIGKAKATQRNTQLVINNELKTLNVDIETLLNIEASVVQWLCHSPCKPGVAGSTPGFSSPSDGTINRGPVSI